MITSGKDTVNPSQHHLIASSYNWSSLQAFAPVDIKWQKNDKSGDSLKVLEMQTKIINVLRFFF